MKKSLFAIAAMAMALPSVIWGALVTGAKELGAYAAQRCFEHMVRTGAIALAAPMRSTDFKPAVEPILNHIFDSVYDLRKDEWKQVFTESQGIDRSYHEDVMLYGFGAAPEMPDGTPVTYQQGGVLFTKRYEYDVFGLAYALTKVLVEDGDAVRIGSIYAKHLANALIETKELRAANVLNRGFNVAYPGGDGVQLFSNAHPIMGGSFSNLLPTPAALSQTSLEQMLIQIRKAVDNNGKPARISPKKLVIGPDNIFQAEVLLGSTLRTGTADNDINPVKSIGGLDRNPAVITRLTSPTAWFVTTDVQEGFKLLMRRSVKKSMEGDFETDSVRYKGTERYGIGWTDPRAAWGTPGA